MRYMRARRAEGFISVIAWFSRGGITLGVATLIIVMSVMNGFRAELVGRILGLNGHVGVYAAGGQGIAEFDPLSVSLAETSGVIAVPPRLKVRSWPPAARSILVLSCAGCAGPIWQRAVRCGRR